MKSKEELKSLKEELEPLNKKLEELSDDKLEQVNGGGTGLNGCTGLKNPSYSHCHGCSYFNGASQCYLTWK